jgi:hypothetical protein
MFCPSSLIIKLIQSLAEWREALQLHDEKEEIAVEKIHNGNNIYTLSEF